MKPVQRATILKNSELAGTLEVLEGGCYHFQYFPDYQGPPVSLSMPISRRAWSWPEFPPFFDGLLPEGKQLHTLLRSNKLDNNDFLTQLVIVGKDLLGDVTVVKMK